MRDKYVEESYHRWFIFGEREGMVDVCSDGPDVISGIPREDAERLIADRNRVIDALCAMARAFDEADHEAFKRFWYVERLSG